MHGSSFGPRDRPVLPAPAVRTARLNSNRTADERTLAEECPVALVYDGTTVAVLMATPADLSDLAIGFSLTEGIIDNVEQIEELTIVPGPDGVELRMWLRPDSGRRLKERRRLLVGSTGCGLCGVESLKEANRVAAPVGREIFLTPEQIQVAIESLTDAQHLNHETRAAHAAGFFTPGNGTMITREDVGRHNALDKLAGRLAVAGVACSSGAIVLTSRISVEMVQKTAAIGAGIIVAISAPTALAVRTAEHCGITLVGIARGSEFEIFTHPAGIALY